MVKNCRSAVLCFLAVALMMSAQAPSNAQTHRGAAVGSTSRMGPDVAACRTKIYSAIGPAHLISPEGIRVTVPMQDAEAARARGFKIDLAALREEANNQKRSEEQAILAKLSDEQLSALFSDVAECTFTHRDALSRDDLVYYGIAMSEMASARQYRSMGHLLVTNDEERVKQYNALVAKYNELLKQCSH